MKIDEIKQQLIESRGIPKRALRFMGYSQPTIYRIITRLKAEGKIKEERIRYRTYSDKKKLPYEETIYLPTMKLWKEQANIESRNSVSRSDLRRWSESMALLCLGSTLTKMDEKIKYLTKSELNINQEIPGQMTTMSYGGLFYSDRGYVVYSALKGAFVKALSEGSEKDASDIIKTAAGDKVSRRIVMVNSPDRLQGMMAKHTVRYTGGSRKDIYMTDREIFQETLCVTYGRNCVKELSEILKGKEYLNWIAELEPLTVTEKYIKADGKLRSKYALNFLYPDISRLKEFTEQLDPDEAVICCWEPYAKVIQELYPKIEIESYEI